MKPIFVSIIIPCYNVEDYVAECLDSAINQTYRPIEIIAVDNNSSDRTLVILKDYEMKNPELITVLEEKKQGAPSARNKGMSVAKGEWLQFLDADDLLLPEKIENQVKLIGGQGNVIVAGAYVDLLLNKKFSIFYLPSSNDNVIATLNSKLGYTSSNLFKKSALISIHGWDENISAGQDIDIIFRVLSTTNFEGVVKDNTTNTIWRERSNGQISKSLNLECYISKLEVRVTALQYLRKFRYDYYAKCRDVLELIVFKYLIYLSRIDKHQAIEFKCKILGINYRPALFLGILPPMQVILIRLLGFTTYLNIIERLRYFQKMQLY